MVRCLSSIFLLVVWSLIGMLANASHATYAQEGTPSPCLLKRQGYDSNCDYIAVANGVHNIGGNGEQAYGAARELVPQIPRDFHEAYYTLLGPRGSDQPFTVNNLGAAPEAFIGMYEALGYDTVFLASTPGNVDLDFARALRDRLAANPGGVFAHLWTVPGPYNPQARVFVVEETGEHISFPYPYHEVAAVASPDDPHSLVILDGLFATPYPMRLEQVAHQLHAFNRAIVVSRNNGTLEDHQRHQMQQEGQPYVVPRLGGSFLTTARRLWGATYQTWGEVIGQPFRARDGEQDKVIVPGTYVQYERVGAGTATLTPLGARVRDEMASAGILPPEVAYQTDIPPLINGIREWAVRQFGSVESFEAAFGKPLTAEFGITQDQMQAVLPLVARQSPGEYYVCVLTERGMVAWSANQGTFLVPLGRVFYERLRSDVDGW